MKRIGFALVAMMFATLTWTPASAEGAIAIGTTNLVKDGIAVGLSTDLGTSRAASRDAITQCKNSGVKASTRALCRVVKTFSGQCAAVAMDPKPGTPGFGVALGTTSKQAQKAALASCNNTAGIGRRGQCRVAGSDCDG